ncbi:hypothetical protein LCGC14_1649860 [marine sediment metagenome]|uniref:HNH nuclease domain-containing protein n=1 Tax=marine sediment metagenome TaxID=412755 RepID=A0A0F9HX63_9ZZZZ
MRKRKSYYIPKEKGLRECEYCRIIFLSRKGVRFCSGKCNAHNSSGRKPKQCLCCGITLHTSILREYCSTQCKKNGNTQTKECAHCGAPFKTNNPKQLYCAQKCRNLAGNGVCKHCGTKFVSFHHTSTVCNDCKDKNKIHPLKEKMKANCKQCGKGFYKINKIHFYCGKKCQKLSSTQYFEDKKERTYFLIFKRDNFKCVYCGKSSIEDGVKLRIDHVFPRANETHNNIDNLATACQPCNAHKSFSMLSKETLLRIWERNKKLNKKFNYNYEELKKEFDKIYKPQDK